MAVLFRVRKGNFNYSGVEKEIMLRDMQAAVQCGVDTVVFGGLNSDRSLDEQFIQQVVDITYGQRLVFHKAFDETKHFNNTIDGLKKFQIDRILSSGCCNTALEGKDNLGKMNAYANGEIEIMAGGAINSANVREIIKASNIKRIHAALLDKCDSNNKYGYAERVDRIELENMLQILKNKMQ